MSLLGGFTATMCAFELDLTEECWGKNANDCRLVLIVLVHFLIKFIFVSIKSKGHFKITNHENKGTDFVSSKFTQVRFMNPALSQRCLSNSRSLRRMTVSEGT